MIESETPTRLERPLLRMAFSVLLLLLTSALTVLGGFSLHGRALLLGLGERGQATVLEKSDDASGRSCRVRYAFEVKRAPVQATQALRWGCGRVRRGGQFYAYEPLEVIYDPEYPESSQLAFSLLPEALALLAVTLACLVFDFLLGVTLLNMIFPRYEPLRLLASGLGSGYARGERQARRAARPPRYACGHCGKAVKSRLPRCPYCLRRGSIRREA